MFSAVLSFSFLSLPLHISFSFGTSLCLSPFRLPVSPPSQHFRQQEFQDMVLLIHFVLALEALKLSDITGLHKLAKRWGPGKHLEVREKEGGKLNA